MIILVILLIVILFGGGLGWHRSGYNGGFGIGLGGLLLILLVCWLLGLFPR
jgi:hypothetical protein